MALREGMAGLGLGVALVSGGLWSLHEGSVLSEKHDTISMCLYVNPHLADCKGVVLSEDAMQHAEEQALVYQVVGGGAVGAAALSALILGIGKATSFGRRRAS